MRKGVLWTVSAGLVLAGCGGSGGGLSTLTRSQVTSLLSRGVQGIGELPSHGGFAIAKKSPGTAKKALFPRPRRSRGSSPRTADEYFDDQLQLWADDFLEGDPNGVHSWGTHYFLDEAETQPAGDDHWDSRWNAWPMIDEENFAITVGPMAGLWAKDHSELNQDGSGNEHGSGFSPDEGGVTFSMSWPAEGITTLTAKYTALDQTWIQYHAEPRPDGGNDYIITDSAGVIMTLKFDGVFSGTGTIEGPSAFLPATLEWDTNGSGTIHWADGSTTTFTNWQF